MKGFIGSGNIDTNSRLCMASSVVGHKRAFGSDLVPGCYEDLELADLVVLVGSQRGLVPSGAVPAHGGGEGEERGVPHRRDRPAPHRRPARAPTCICRCGRAATCVLLNGLLAYLAAPGAVDRAFVARHTTGFGARALGSRSDARPPPRPPRTAASTEGAVALLLRLVRRRPSASSRSIRRAPTSRRSGVDKVNAIINCHLATGRIGRPGMGPFSITGQPNAMGGREVGGLANQLAAHMELRQRGRRDRVAPLLARAGHRANGPG